MTLFRPNSGTFQDSMDKMRIVEDLEDIFNILDHDKFYTKNNVTKEDLRINKDGIWDHRNGFYTCYLFLGIFMTVGYIMWSVPK